MGHPDQRNNFTKDTREPSTSALKRATNGRIKTKSYLLIEIRR